MIESEQGTTTADAVSTANPRRTWPAILTLYLLAPILGEVFSWSTPPLKLLVDPFALIFEPALYGSGALLIREIARRRGLGWGNILVLGAAYGVMEEAIDVQTWFNPAGLHDLGIYGRAWETNWVWAIGLTVFHIVFSITLPIVLAEAFFPSIADRPWFGRKGRGWLTAWLVATVAFGAIGYGFIVGKGTGYTHPPLLPYLMGVTITLVLYLLGVRLRFPPPRPSARVRRLPKLWTVRWAAFGATATFFFAFYGLPNLVAFAPIEIAVLAAIVIFGVLRTRSWAAIPGWNAEYRLALASGALGFWIVASSVVWYTGLPLVALIALILLVRLARRTAITTHSALAQA